MHFSRNFLDETVERNVTRLFIEGGIVELYDIDTGKLKFSVRAHDDQVTAIKVRKFFNPNILSVHNLCFPQLKFIFQFHFNYRYLRTVYIATIDSSLSMVIVNPRKVVKVGICVGNIKLTSNEE